MKKIVILFFSFLSALVHAYVPTTKIVIYMGADNDLAPYALWDLVEMQQANPQALESIPVFVQLDLPDNLGHRRFRLRPERYSRPMTLQNFQNEKFENIIKSSSVMLPEVSPEGIYGQLVDYLLWANQNAPTDETIFILWGHGEGFTTASDVKVGGLVIDKSQRSRLSITELRYLLRDVNNQTHTKIDMLITDACLMQTLEVAMELSDVVDYLVGSTQIQNFRGLPYTNIINQFYNKLLSSEFSRYSSASHLMAKLVVDESRNSLAEENSNDFKNFTMSSLSVMELKKQFLPQWQLALTALTHYLNQDRFNKMELKQRLEKMPEFLGSTRDLAGMIGVIEHFLTEAGPDAHALKHEFKKAHIMLNRALVNYHMGDAYLPDNHYAYIGGYFKAFGAWFPADKKQYKAKIKDYQESQYFQTPAGESFEHFLKLLYF